MFKRVSAGFVLVMTLAGMASAEDLRDPTKPPQQRQVSQQLAAITRYSLDSILVSDSRRIAVVNGTSLAVGESVGNATVRRIARDRVLLEINGKTHTLVLDSAPSIRR